MISQNSDMAEPLAAFVIDKLGNLLLQEAIFLYKVREKVKRLQNELRRMQAYLQDADRKQAEDESLKTAISEIREAVYDAEDVIESYIVNKLLQKSREGVWNFMKRYANIITEFVEIHQVGSEVDAITKTITDFTTRLLPYGITPAEPVSASSCRKQISLRRSYSHVLEEDTIGLEEDERSLVSQLINFDTGCQVLSICGMGGLGKTTIAKKVYHNHEVRHDFESFAWAYISQQCQARHVWERILLKLISPTKEQQDEIVNLRDEEVARRLYQIQVEKKCLVVIDDIWSADAWNSLSPGFPVGKAESASKIVLTTRNTEVALHVDPTCFLHEPKCLNEDENWTLFRKKAFPKDDPDSPISIEMEQLGREMVGRCAGLPLAIIVLGGLLATKPTFHDWDLVRQNINSYLRRAHSREQLLTVNDVLALSYYDIPYLLKPCFLHLAHFPVNSEIQTKKLTRLWIAEGLVLPMHEEGEGGEETMEQVAMRYLNELVERCMIQVVERSATGRIRSCRMHELMRDLCLEKAKQENFLDIINSWNEVHCLNMVYTARSRGKTRRVAIFLDPEVNKIIPSQFKKNRHLRSVLCFHEREFWLQKWGTMKSVFKHFKLLRVLDLEGIQGQEGKLPKEIGNLIHLRYLSLRYTNIDELPPTIGNLICLQTLDLLTWNSTVRIPNILWKLERMRHLYLPQSCIDSAKSWKLVNLRSLQTLVNFPAEKCDVKDLIQLTNLRKLVIDDPIFGEIFKSEGVMFSKLESLFLVSNEDISLDQIMSACPSLYKLSIEGPIQNLPRHDQISSKLAKLKLQGSYFSLDPMATLEKLPHLRVLELQMDSYLGNCMTCTERGFPQLRSLFLCDLTNLELWSVDKGSFPRLSGLHIANCTKLKMIPEGLRFVSTLQKLDVKSMFRGFRMKLEKGGEEHYKVEHIPSLTFRFCDY